MFFAFFIFTIITSLLAQPAPDYGQALNRPFIKVLDSPCYRPRGYLKPLLCFEEANDPSIFLCPCATVRPTTTTTDTTPTRAPELRLQGSSSVGERRAPAREDASPCFAWGII